MAHPTASVSYLPPPRGKQLVLKYNIIEYIPITVRITQASVHAPTIPHKMPDGKPPVASYSPLFFLFAKW